MYSISTLIRELIITHETVELCGVYRFILSKRLTLSNPVWYIDYINREEHIMLAPAYTYRTLPETFKTLNATSTRNELKAALKELRDLAYTDIKLNCSTQEMIEEVLHLQWVHRDDVETTVEEIETAFYADPVEQETECKGLAMVENGVSLFDIVVKDTDIVKPSVSHGGYVTRAVFQGYTGSLCYLLKSQAQQIINNALFYERHGLTYQIIDCDIETPDPVQREYNSHLNALKYIQGTEQYGFYQQYIDKRFERYLKTVPTHQQ